ILSEALEASDTNEGCGQPDRYRGLICHLSNPRFLANNNKDVQIWLACCLADILRIFAPNVPLGDPTQLKNLSVVSTLVLCLELPHDDTSQVIRMLIKTAMEVANGRDWKGEIRETSDDGSAADDDSEDKSETRDKVGLVFLVGI
ncbi:hypothetical protein TELCIR_22664, partial [Teladorsagia circumcincta]